MIKNIHKKAKTKSCMLVLGMHRSGTSALAGSFNSIGFNVGRNVMSPDKEQNSKGFFENEEFYLLNESILADCQLTWDTDQKIDIFDLPRHKIRFYINCIKRIIASQFELEEERILIKDPRICLLLPLYVDAIKELGYDIYVAIVYRNPAQISASLYKRNKIKIEKAYRLTANYLLQAEYHSRNLKRYFISYADLLKSPRVILDLLSEDLKIDPKKSIQPISNFIDEKLRHHTAVTIEQKGDFEIVSKIYKILCDESGKSFSNLNLLFDKLRIDFYHRKQDFKIIQKVSNEKLELVKSEVKGSKEKLTMQIFLDFGVGFNQNDSITKEIEIHTSSVRFDFSSFNDIKSIRLDPINKISEITIQNIILENEKGERSFPDFKSNAAVKITKRHLIFDQNDPQLVISNLPEGSLKFVEIFFTIVSIGELALERAKLFGEKKQLSNEVGEINSNIVFRDVLDRYEKKIDLLESNLNQSHQLSTEQLVKFTQLEITQKIKQDQVDKLNAQLAEVKSEYSFLSQKYESEVKELKQHFKQNLEEQNAKWGLRFQKSEQAFEEEKRQFKLLLKTQMEDLDKIRKSDLSAFEMRLLRSDNKFKEKEEAIKNRYAKNVQQLKEKEEVIKNNFAQYEHDLREKEAEALQKAIELERQLKSEVVKHKQLEESHLLLKKKYETALDQFTIKYNKKEEQLASFQKKFENKKYENISLKEELKHWDVKYDGVQQKIESAQEEIDFNKNELVSEKKLTFKLTEKIDSLHMDIFALREEEVKTSEVISSYQSEVDKRGELIDEIRDSLSYKIGRFFTYPLRLISDIFRSPQYSESYSTGKFSLYIKLLFVAFLNPIATLRNLNRGNLKVLSKAIGVENAGQILNNYKYYLQNAESINLERTKLGEIHVESAELEQKESNADKLEIEKSIQPLGNSSSDLAVNIQYEDIPVKNHFDDFECKLHCDGINSTRFNLELHGWAVTPIGIDVIEIFSGSRKLGNAVLGLPRPDVQVHFPEIESAVSSGYKFLCSKSVPNLDKIEIRAKDKKGKQVKIFKSDPYLNLEQQYEKYLKICNKKKTPILSKTVFNLNPLFGLVLILDDSSKIYIENTLSSIRSQKYKKLKLLIFSKPSNRSNIEYFNRKWNILFRESLIIYEDSLELLHEKANQEIGNQNCDWFFLISQGDELMTSALLNMVSLINNHPSAKLLYFDHDELNKYSNREKPKFKSSLNPDLLRSTNYIGNAFVFTKTLFDQLDGFNLSFYQEYKYYFLLQALEETSEIYHIQKVLFNERVHLKKKSNQKEELSVIKNYVKHYVKGGTAVKGLVEGSYRIIREIREDKLVSIIIPFKDDIQTLKVCIDSIERYTLYKNYELILVSNNSVEPETFEYLKELKTRDTYFVYEYNVPFNYSKICNFGVTKSNGELLLMLNNDVEVITKSWLNAMVEHIQRKEVGAVGAKLLYHDNTIQHAGVILNLSGLAAHTHKYFPDEDNGYLNRANTIQNFSICTAACLLVNRKTFEKIGGFDESNLAVSFNDVDLCLKIRSENLLVVYTPYAKLYHYESKSRGEDDTAEKKERVNKEIAYFKERWKIELENGDPYYNRNLTLRRKDFSLNVEF